MKKEKLLSVLFKSAIARIGESNVNASIPKAPGIASPASKPLGSLSSEIGVAAHPIPMTQPLTGNSDLKASPKASLNYGYSPVTRPATPVQVAGTNPGYNSAKLPAVKPSSPVASKGFSQFTKLSEMLGNTGNRQRQGGTISSGGSENRSTPYSSAEIGASAQSLNYPTQAGTAAVIDFPQSSRRKDNVSAIQGNAIIPQKESLKASQTNFQPVLKSMGRKANAAGVMYSAGTGNYFDAAKAVAKKEVPGVNFAGHIMGAVNRGLNNDIPGALLEGAGAVVPVVPDAIQFGRDFIRNIDEQVEDNKRLNMRSREVQGSLKESRNTGIVDVDGRDFVNSSDVELLGKLGFSVTGYLELTKTSEVLDIYSYIEKVAGVPKAAVKAIDKGEAFSGSYLKDMEYNVPEGYEVKGDLCCPKEKTTLLEKESSQKTVKERVRVVLPYEGQYILERLKNPKYPDNLDKRRHIGGGIEAGETPAQAAARELHEELGIKVDHGDFKHIGKFDNQHYLLLPEHNIKPGKYKASVGSDPFIHLEHGMPSGADYMGPDVHKLMKPGLWANIHAKKARGEKAAKPGDEAYPDKEQWDKLSKEAKQTIWTPKTKFSPFKPLQKNIAASPEIDLKNTELYSLLDRQLRMEPLISPGGQSGLGLLDRIKRLLGRNKVVDQPTILNKTAQGRCWEGYKPVPGKEPYSDDSCEPVEAKKKKESELEKEQWDKLSKEAELEKEAEYKWYKSKDLHRDVTNGRHYPFSFFTGEAKELVDAIKNRDMANFKEEIGDTTYAAQMLAAQATGLNHPVLADLSKFYKREKAWKDIFNEKGGTYHPKHMEGGSNYAKPSKIIKAFASAGIKINQAEAERIADKYTGGNMEKEATAWREKLMSGESNSAKRYIANYRDVAKNSKNKQLLGILKDLDAKDPSGVDTASISHLMNNYGLSFPKQIKKASTDTPYSQPTVENPYPGIIGDGGIMAGEFMANRLANSNAQAALGKSKVPPNVSSLLGKARMYRNIVKAAPAVGVVTQANGAYDRYKKQDYLGAAIDAAGAVGSAAQIAPHPVAKGVGLGVSVASTVASAGRDIHRYNNRPVEFRHDPAVLSNPGQASPSQNPVQIPNAPLAKQGEATHELKSSNIKAVGHDKKDKALEVHFHSGGEYKYSDVPASLFYRLLKVKSPGKFFHKHIRNDDKYSYEKTAARRLPKVKLNQPLLPGLTEWVKHQPFNHAEELFRQGEISAKHRDDIVSGRLFELTKDKFKAMLDTIANTPPGI